ncbi:hypothetical protein SAMN06265371_102420 [Lutibacter agarilyticus]|uniref:Uncharacterized protein n=1 Tax=Lutibacter agarilyticus TaxID=1109740 RepID=A0A238W5K2_9FLAO|nr:hypothetical protein SAMN06265371_102420 [Lutibacter agarilyticus]
MYKSLEILEKYTIYCDLKYNINDGVLILVLGS